MAVVSATRVEFCQTTGGHRVAYAQAGSGRPLVMLSGWLSHVEQVWTHPAAASARAKLARSHRFICTTDLAAVCRTGAASRRRSKATSPSSRQCSTHSHRAVLDHMRVKMGLVAP